MLELVLLLLVLIIVGVTLVPAVLAFIGKSGSFLKNALFTLVFLFIILTIVNDVYNYGHQIYWTESYKQWLNFATGGRETPMQESMTYVSNNKKWVVLMVILFIILMYFFSS